MQWWFRDLQGVADHGYDVGRSGQYRHRESTILDRADRDRDYVSKYRRLRPPLGHRSRSFAGSLEVNYRGSGNG